MSEIIQGFLEAIRLIVTLNPEVIEITVRSLGISVAATVIASLLSVPLGALISFNEFRGRRTLINTIQTLYALPTVIVGLLLFLLLTNVGPLGFLGILFTPEGMVLGQTILIMPIIIGLTISALSGIGRDMRDTIVSLGATQIQMILMVIREARFAVISAVILGFGRAISEVGVATMIGGNIRGATRVLTTVIALETSIGNFATSIALGIILLGVAVIVNVGLSVVQQRWKD